MIIEYPISENYVKKWGVWEAVREFLQNGLDADNMTLDYDLIKGQLTIKNDGSLSRDMLLLGESNKGDDDRGQFGEGMKLGMLVLARMGRFVRVSTGTEDWYPRLIDSATFEAKVFAVEVKKDWVGDGVEVVIEITKGEWQEIQNKFVDKPYGILEDTKAGSIFVGGLFVCHIKGFEHAYNFSPTDIRLNRDRDIPYMWDIQRAASKSISGEEIIDLALRGKKDVSEDISYIAKQKAADAWVSNYAGVTPIGISEQGTVSNKHTRVVPDWLAKMIRGCKDFVMSWKTSPVQRLEAWYKAESWQLNSQASDELNSIIQEMKG